MRAHPLLALWAGKSY